MSTAAPDIGYDVPAAVGMDIADVQTPCLILDLDALERNIKKMGELAAHMGVAHRAHGKMHKSADVALLQEHLGGAVGQCCQKVSEAEALARGGVTDILISNQVRDPVKIDRLARLPLLGVRTQVCVDDLANVAELSNAAVYFSTTLECLAEVDCGGRRCGVATPEAAVKIARAITDAPSLTFAGIQAYHGNMQHLETCADRKAAIDDVLVLVRDVLAALESAGLACPVVTGAGTGSFPFEGTSGIYTEIQCGSYAFMDADYGRVLDEDGNRLDDGMWENALFILSSIMSTAIDGRAVCDAGLKSTTIESGLPVVRGRKRLEYWEASDEHGIILDPDNALRVNEKLKLIPGHCDPTCNLHDWYVGIRNDRVETLWPISARGKSY